MIVSIHPVSDGQAMLTHACLCEGHAIDVVLWVQSPGISHTHRQWPGQENLSEVYPLHVGSPK